jgi:FKBP-type peptidyl-prolyl cis-trans isomerase 2
MLSEKDFIEIEFTAKVKDGEVFDSNIKEDLEKANLNVEAKPFVFALGEGMFLKGIEDILIGKPDSGEYEIELSPEKAFGKRNSKLIQIVPSRIFREQKLNPVHGMIFNFDGRIGKVLSVSGGRIIVDFNNPIAGKTVVYKIKVLRKVTDLKEKAKSFINFLFKRDFDFEVKDKKLLLKAEKPYAKFIEIFKDKFKDILGLDLEVEEIKKGDSEEKPLKSQ